MSIANAIPMTAEQLRRRRLWLAFGYLMIGAVIWLSLTASPVPLPRFALADKAAHALAYALLMGWFGQLYQRPMLRLGYAFAFILLGVVLEFAQGIGGRRMFDTADMAANASGVLVAWLALRCGADGMLLWVERRVMGSSAASRRGSP